jgi:hypothetical protein
MWNLDTLEIEYSTTTGLHHLLSNLVGKGMVRLDFVRTD